MELSRRGLLFSRKIFIFLFLVVSLIMLGNSVWPTAGYFPVDFKYFWLSGKLWASGISPYGPELQTLGEQVFPERRINPFFYPPNWMIVSSLLGLVDARTAATIWAILSAGALVLASWQIASLMAHIKFTSTRLVRFTIILFGLVILTYSGAKAIYIGQPAPILLCAFTSLLMAMHRRDQSVTTLALIVLLLKPQFSIPLIVAVFIFMPWARKSVLQACVATALLAVFGLDWNAPGHTLSQFLGNLSLYEIYPENWPIHMSGPNFLLALFGIPAISAFVWLAASLTVNLGMGALARHRWVDVSTPNASVLFLINVGTWTLLLLPTHNSDLLLTAPIILFWTISGTWSRLLIMVGLFLIMRSHILSVSLTSLAFDEQTLWVALLDTVGLTALALVAAQAMSAEPMRTPSTAPIN